MLVNENFLWPTRDWEIGICGESVEKGEIEIGKRGGEWDYIYPPGLSS